MRAPALPVLLLTSGFLAGCSTPRELTGAAPGPVTEVAARPAAAPASVETNWKERIAQPYVYVEALGDYRDLGATMRRLFEAAGELELEPSGPPFALFFDDPGRVPTAELRARACLPVRESPGRLGALAYDVLPRAMVVYARVAGAYPEVPRSYPALFAYLRELGWQPGGPVREVYLVDPGSVASFDELVTEVQIPWSAAGG